METFWARSAAPGLLGLLFALAASSLARQLAERPFGCTQPRLLDIGLRRHPVDILELQQSRQKTTYVEFSLYQYVAVRHKLSYFPLKMYPVCYRCYCYLPCVPVPAPVLVPLPVPAAYLIQLNSATEYVTHCNSCLSLYGTGTVINTIRIYFFGTFSLFYFLSE